MKNLENSVVQAVDRFPELAQQMVLVLSQVSALVTQIDGAGLPEKFAQTLALVNRVLDQVGAALVALEPGTLSKEGQQTLKALNAAIAGVSEIVSRVGGEKGLAMSLQRTSETLGSMARNANYVGPAMEDAMKDVQGAAQSVQRFADSLEQDPDMLIKGRARRVSK